MKNKQEESDLWSEERRFWESGCTCICGADEAGAGPLAGPVYAAAVILPPGRLIPGLNDSKKLTARQREILFDQICAEAQAYAVASVDEQTIDVIDILNARIRAMDEAIRQLVPKPDFALIDGNRDRMGAAAVSPYRMRCWSKVTAVAPTLRQLRFWQKLAVTIIWNACQRNIQSMALDSIKGMERSSTMRRWTAVGPVRPIGAVFW